MEAGLRGRGGMGHPAAVHCVLDSLRGGGGGFPVSHDFFAGGFGVAGVADGVEEFFGDADSVGVLIVVGVEGNLDLPVAAFELDVTEGQGEHASAIGRRGFTK